MNKTYKNVFIVLLIAILITLGLFAIKQGKKSYANPVKIGVIAPLTGDLAFLGEDVQTGVALARKDLEKEGIKAEIIVEDGQIDPKVALDAAQKLVNSDQVNAIYSNFNPAAYSVSSFLKDKNIAHLYYAAPVSPLKESSNNYKSFEDLERDCGTIAKLLQSKGIQKVGVLKGNWEPGELCTKGITDTFGDNAIVSTYELGTTDFRTMLTKINASNVEAVFNVALPPETWASLRNMRDLGMKMPLIAQNEVLAPDLIKAHASLMEGMIFIGMPDASVNFKQKVKSEMSGKVVANYPIAANAYVHTMQLARAYAECGSDTKCVKSKLDNALADSLSGFNGFKNRIAQFDVLIQRWTNGGLVNYN